MSLDVALIDPTTTYEDSILYEYNITHNLDLMAKEANLYEALWSPSSIDAIIAENIIQLLKVGLKELREKPDKYKRLNPSNSWGNYLGLVKFVVSYLAACEEFPKAKIIINK